MLLEVKAQPWSHGVGAFHRSQDVHRLTPLDKVEFPRFRFVALAAKRSPKRLKYSAPRFSKEDGLLYVEADPSGTDSWKLEPVADLLKEELWESFLRTPYHVMRITCYGTCQLDVIMSLHASYEHLGRIDLRRFFPFCFLFPYIGHRTKGIKWVTIHLHSKYAIVCHLRSHSAIERLRRIKDIEASKARKFMVHPHNMHKVIIHLLSILHLKCFRLQLFPFMFSDVSVSLMQPLSILCRSLRDIDTYTTGFPCGIGQGQTNIFRAVKHCLPGPYTFILTASKELPKQCTRYGTTTAKYASRKNVGVRMPDDAICKAILQMMDAPLIATSVKSPKENEWMLDPITIADVYGPEV
ncbi:hypothetical protein CK203_015148 [Vitis vinifera]|uniref:Threonylcarbamoyl-AMP synthase n=1 Tax=Vitis vinifera TaxID=29760 RepID=A0A438JDC7_VITVI|nr:hypothetical protein CK203_015148 [Vitis vinifera]